MDRNNQPNLVVHADWSVQAGKRWMVRAVQQADGYRVQAPEPVGIAGDFISRLSHQVGPESSLLVGFDFPIGLPLSYAQAVGVQDFTALLPQLGQGIWRDFYSPASRPEEISLYRPFYPLRPGGCRQAHLLQALRVDHLNALRRRCELARPGRRAAAPLFWTLGGQQVGKAAIHGWKTIISPILQDRRSHSSPLAHPVRLWPFEGRFSELLAPIALVIAETYPAEFYDHLGLDLQRTTGTATAGSGPRGKRSQAARKANAPAIFAWAKRVEVDLEDSLAVAVADGFGSTADGEDRFDALVGALGMLNLRLGRRNLSEPPPGSLRQVEGWILGQTYT